MFLANSMPHISVLTRRRLQDLKKHTKVILLLGWFIIAAALYFTAVKYEFGPIMPIYMFMSLFFGVAFFLVNGGLRPTVKTHTAYIQDTRSKKQKTRMRYKNDTCPHSPAKDAQPRANIFKLKPEKQRFYAELFLILFLAPTAVLVADYVMIVFIPFYI